MLPQHHNIIIMGLRIPSLLLAATLAVEQVSAFVPRSIRTSTPLPSIATTTTARYFGVDPSAFHDLPQHIQHLPNAFSSLTISAEDVMGSLANAASSVVQPAVDAASSAVQPATDVVNEVATKDNGWFGFLTEPISLLLQLIHSGLTMAGMQADSWGVSIVALTVLIKLVTFPLTKTQLESTNKMQVRIMILFDSLY